MFPDYFAARGNRFDPVHSSSQEGRRCGACASGAHSVGGPEREPGPTHGEPSRWAWKAGARHAGLLLFHRANPVIEIDRPCDSGDSARSIGYARFAQLSTIHADGSRLWAPSAAFPISGPPPERHDCGGDDPEVVDGGGRGQRAGLRMDRKCPRAVARGWRCALWGSGAWISGAAAGPLEPRTSQYFGTRCVRQSNGPSEPVPLML